MVVPPLDASAPSARRMNLGRSTSVMAVGTAASRATGFLRVLALFYALGYNRLSDAYLLANTLPNIVYELVLGGVVSATLVPLFVNLFEGDDDDPWRGVAAVTWLVLAVTAGLSVVFALAAPLLATPYAALNNGSRAAAQKDLTVAFMRYFAPQVMLLAGMAVGSAVLTARRRFAAPMFAPVLNNLVVIGALVLARDVISRAEIQTLHVGTGLVVLGAGTTLGYVAQLVGLLPSLKSIGARLRPVWDPRHPAVRRAVALSGWTVGFVIANQVAYLIVVALANKRGGELSSYQAAFQFFQLPHAVIAVSITNALLPELSVAAGRGEAERFLALFRRGLRVIALFLVPAAVIAVVFAQPLLRPVLEHGRVTSDALVTTASALSAFALGLPGFSAFILCTRALQARQDTRRVFYLYGVENGINIALALALYPSMHVRGLALSYAAAYTISAGIAYVVVMRTSGRTRGIR
ncbi:MAG TPA: murein biosynthesis integral membrane protein MurJ [Acidimicrobiales bacterium]|nr:murein biosynthesis integral membrane protein MurJ [Acidimicrobiales bacterium]